MKPNLRQGLFGALVVIGLAQPDPGGAYELRTHGEITRRAYEKSEGMAAYLSAIGVRDVDRFDPEAATDPRRLALFENFGTALDWMIEGAIREDEYVENLLLILAGCPRPANPSTTSRVLNHFFDVQRGGRGLAGPLGQLGFPAPDWALGHQGRGPGPKENQFSLPDAREYQYQSLTAPSPAMRDQFTARLFRTLGHVLHIVEDMAQPQHTRNDPHAGCVGALDAIVGGHSWYEHYVEERTLRRALRPAGEIPPELVLLGYDPVRIRPYQEFFTDPTRGGLADFSSRNFLSAGTNLADTSTSCAGLPEPPCNVAAYQQVALLYSTTTLKGTVSAPVTFYTRDVVDALTGQVVPNVPLTSRSVWDQHLETIGRQQKFSLNRFNYDAMADILLPRAVGYAAGFLDAFFRGYIGAMYEEDRLRITGSSEAMSGEFRLLYERTDGTRGEVAAWAGIQLGPDGVSQPLSTPQLPEDAAPDAPCLLVFRGQLGPESGAVAGAQVGCPPPPPPPPPPAGQWYMYYCATFIASHDYRYATMDPPFLDSELVLLFYHYQPSTGTSFGCSLRLRRQLEQPPGSRTDHPV